MAPTVERVTSVEHVEIGEGPHWDEATQSLYFVNFPEQSICRYDPQTNKHFSAVIDIGPTSFIIPVENQKNKFLISPGRELQVITWDGQSPNAFRLKKIAEVDDEEGYRENRFNDGKADPAGRLWAGTMPSAPDEEGQFKPIGSLFSFDSRGKEQVHLPKQIGISNGLAWSSDNTKFYYIDSIKRRVDQCDFDLDNGTISNEKTIFSFAKNNIAGFPDGMTIDTDGNLWVAAFHNSSLIKIDPKRPETLLDTVILPVKQVTSVAFGGPNLDELYVTTGSIEWNGEKSAGPDNGALYKVTGTGSKGFPGVDVKLNLK